MVGNEGGSVFEEVALGIIAECRWPADDGLIVCDFPSTIG